MAVIRFDQTHKLEVVESADEIHQKMIGAGGGNVSLIQVAANGHSSLVTVNVQQIRTVSAS